MPEGSKNIDGNTPWSLLTRIPLKKTVYGRETYFREGLADAREAFGEAFAPMSARAALLMVKPDGLAAGKAAAIVDFVTSHGYSIVAVEAPVLTRHQWRELWRYQLTSATLDRLAVNDLVLCQPALLLLLRDDTRSPWPGTVRLSVLKGPSDVSQQSADCLRRRIGQPNRVFSFFHVADEPADLLRELGVLLAAPQRQRVLGALRSGEMAPDEDARLRDAVARSAREARNLDPAAAIERVAGAVAMIRGGDTVAVDRVLSDLDRMRKGGRIEWRQFAVALGRTGAGVDPWDVATLGATFIVYDEPGHSKLLVAGDPAMWLTAAAASSTGPG